MGAAPLDRGAGDVGRLLVGGRGKEVGAGLLGDGAQLLDRRRTVDVAGNGEHFFALGLAQPFGQLADGSGLARALQAGHQDDGRRLGGQIEFGRTAAHQVGEFAVHDAHQGLTRCQAGQHFLAERLFADAGDQVAHHRQRDIGLEQRDADLAQHFLGVGLGETGLAAQGLDDAG